MKFRRTDPAARMIWAAAAIYAVIIAVALNAWVF